jgi:hypothetical protein
VDKPPEERNFWNGGPVMDGVPAAVYLQKPAGTGGYDEFPSEQDPKPWELPPGSFGPGKTDELKLPVFIKHNAYFKGAKPWVKEPDPLVNKEAGVEIGIDAENCQVRVAIEDPALFSSNSTEIITTAVLGTNFHTEMKYEDADGRPYTLDRDFLGQLRSARPVPGPFEVFGDSPVTFELSYKKKS